MRWKSTPTRMLWLQWVQLTKSVKLMVWLIESLGVDHRAQILTFRSLRLILTDGTPKKKGLL